MASYIDLNRANWDDRAPAHFASPDYAVESFIADPHFLSEVVRFDLPLLGDVRGLRGVHVQCHIGHRHDLARTSRRKHDRARLLRRVGRRGQASFGTVGHTGRLRGVHVFDALSVLPAGSFDLVYTGVGALCWLPEVRPWAEVVAGLLRPGGRLFIREGHPMMWAIDETRTEGLVIGYRYFERPEPIVDEDPGTYVTTEAEFTQNVTHSWNHGLGEMFVHVASGEASLSEAGRRFESSATADVELCHRFQLLEVAQRVAVVPELFLEDGVDAFL